MAIVLNGQTDDITIGGESVATDSEVSNTIGATLGNISTTELGYLDGVTGNIQTSLDLLKSVPANVQSTSYTLALSDRGLSIDTSAGVTVPLNSAVAFPIGTVITITNTSAAAITITQTAGVTLRNAGTTTTGNRTLANYGMATLRKVATDTWFISGAGLS